MTAAENMAMDETLLELKGKGPLAQHHPLFAVFAKGGFGGLSPGR
jgi:hypothetical protein